MSYKLLWIIGILLFVLVACDSDQPADNPDTPEATAVEQAAATEEAAAARPIVLGDISDNPARRIQRIQPLADYLATNLADQGFNAGEARIAPDLDTMIQW